MPRPFHELTLEEFAELLSQFPFTRRIESVHMHHTWRPNHSNFRAHPPLASIEGMYNHHTRVNGWNDIAQHITIDPRGKIWTGRNWNRPPVSAIGFNGSSAAGPFMFEIIGDFDAGRDPFDGAQKEAVIGVIVSLLRRFNLPPEAVRFHNQMSTKTCPGSAVPRAAFLEEVREALANVGQPRELGAFSEEESARRQRTLSIIAQWEANSRDVSFEDVGVADEPGEETMNANDVAVVTGADTPAATGRSIFGRGTEFTPDEKQLLRRHVVNLRLGLFSDSGLFETSLADVKRIFEELLPDELARCKAEGRPLRLVFYAHGGLVSEEEGIRPILRRLAFWRENGMYPIFFCWETGLRESLSDLLKGLFTGQRNIFTDATDAVIEAAASIPGREVWSQMKRSAELASLPGGGARTVAELTRDFWNTHHKDMQIHALGHSAGAIFHAFFLPVLLDQKVKTGVPPLSVKTLHFLAPACTAELFKTKLLARVGPKKAILSHTMYTMNKDLEQADTAGPYRKSLLYLVSRAFEKEKPTPILGLEESLRDDPALIRFYGLTRTIPGIGQLLFSKTPSDAPLDSATISTTHGDFDNEAKTMNSVARRILERPTGSIVSFVDETARNEVSRALAALPTPAPAPARASLPPVTRAAVPGSRKALCIGIDAYPAPHALAGCVNDARDWSALLESLGFAVRQLFNQQATRAAILSEIETIITNARAGDVVAIQFSGHGTQVQDLDGDETTGKDEALVPIDFATGSFVIDDDLRAIMSRIPADVNVTCFMDCCHSGTNTRLFGATPVIDGQGSRPRFIQATPEMNAAHRTFRSQLHPGPALAARTSEQMREVSFAACLDTQVAFETNGSGDFTRLAMQILRPGLNGLTHAAFRQRVLDAFGLGARQEPFLDCAPASVSGLLLESLGRGAVFQPAADSDVTTAILRRLEAIERRLTNLGG